ncbi:hypothetical protein [Streptomyces sp. Midd1]|uniref:hypothetical protein n=1 Tax=Streptomyces sp. Midd3 TaxID=3161191 RepID=UPI0034DACDCC
MKCTRLESGQGSGRRITELTVADALASLDLYRFHRPRQIWSVNWSRFSDHIKITCKSTRSDYTDVVRVPHSVALLMDRRYTISRTWVGEPAQRYVAWFCDQFISHHATDIEAADALLDYRRNVQGFTLTDFGGSGGDA